MLGADRQAGFLDNYNMGLWATTTNRKDNYHYPRHLAIALRQSLCFPESPVKLPAYRSI
jgi:hypothetical protein